MSGRDPRGRRELGTQRRPKAHGCWGHLIIAPLWPMHDANLGTLLRTCDAVGACLAVPRAPRVRPAVAKGNTLRRRSCVHWVNDPVRWLRARSAAGNAIVGVELVDGARRLAELAPARETTIVVLGHEQTGIPAEALDLVDVAVEIPMVGTGFSLNVAVSGSLVAYKLAGMI